MLQKASIKKVSLLVIMLYLIVYFSPITLYLIPNVSVTPNIIIWANTFSYIIGALLMIFIYLKTKNTANLSIEKQSPTSFWKNLLFGISGIFGAIIVQSVIFSIESAITGNNIESQNTQAILESLMENPIFILAITIGGPIMEEFVFRRSIVGLLEPKTGFWITSIISAALFSIFHLDGHFFVYFFMGFFFTLLYKKTGSISTSIIAHCGMNSFVVLAQIIISNSL